MTDTNNGIGFLVCKATGEIQEADRNLNPGDFGCETWAEVLNAPREVDLVDGFAWCVDQDVAKKIAAEILGE
jgi:hypothetical protein